MSLMHTRCMCPTSRAPSFILSASNLGREMFKFNVESLSPRCVFFAIARLCKDTYECKIHKDWRDIVDFLGTDFRLPQLHKPDFELPRMRQECLKFASRAHVLPC